VADKLIKSGCYQKALVVSVDLMTRYTDYGDPQTAPLFGDGAGAVVLSPREDGGGLLASRIFSDGTLADLVQTPGGGTRHPCSVATLTEKMHFMKMRGNVLFKKAVSAMAEASQIVIEESGLTTEEIDLVIPHQGNQRITDAVAERLGVPAEKVYSNIARFGNTASASIPIAISECARAGRIKPGETLLLTACGAGFTWGAAIMRW
jgi:3-oxoacyl-[acyl-carrier-protein] synthase-3